MATLHRDPPATTAPSEELAHRARLGVVALCTFVVSSVFALIVVGVARLGFGVVAGALVGLWLVFQVPWLALMTAAAGDLVMLLVSGRAHSVPAIMLLGEMEDRDRELAGRPPLEEESGPAWPHMLVALSNPLTPLLMLAMMYIRTKPASDEVEETVERIRSNRFRQIAKISGDVGRDARNLMGGGMAPQH